MSDGSEAQHWELLRIFPYHEQDRLLFFFLQIISLKMFESTNVPPTEVFVDCCVKWALNQETTDDWAGELVLET